MKRHRVNRSSSNKSFNGRANRTAKLNKRIGLRGGIRL